MHGATVVGNFVSAERSWAQFDRTPRPTTRNIYRPGNGECSLAELRFLQGKLDEELLAKAETIATAGNNRRAVRKLCLLRGEWMLSLGRYAEAAIAFERYVNLTGEVNLDSSGDEARVALAEAKLGQTGKQLKPRYLCSKLNHVLRSKTRPNGQATETANRLSALENPPHLDLAELKFGLGDTEGARHHIIPAYRDAWADGTPYVNWWHLQRARAVLAALGDPEPQLPPFDPSTVKPFPFEAQLRSYLEQKKAEKEAAQAKQE
jgi:hypothetical protein